MGMDDRDEISAHEVRVFEALRKAGAWLMAQEVAKRAKTSPRTTRLHLRTMAQHGLVAIQRVYPGPRYRLVEATDSKGREYKARLTAAAKVFAQD